MADRRLQLAQMTRAQLDAAAILHNITVPAGATADDVRKLLDATGNFSWNWPLANFLGGILLLFAAGFTPLVWAITIVMIALVLLIADAYRSWDRVKAFPNFGKAFLKDAGGELLGITLIISGLVLGMSVLFIFAAAIVIFDGIQEQWL